MELQQNSTKLSLYTEAENSDNVLTRTGKIVNPKCFYGKNIAFQFCPSIRPVIKLLVVSMASYYNFYFDSHSKFVKVLRFQNSFAKYLFSPNKRAAKYVYASENSSIKFCKVNFHKKSRVRTKLNILLIYSRTGSCMKGDWLTRYQACSQIKLKSTKLLRFRQSRWKFSAQNLISL